MTRSEATEKILAARIEKGLSFQQIAESVGRHPVWVTAALHGQATMSAAEAQKAVGHSRPGRRRRRRPSGDPDARLLRAGNSRRSHAVSLLRNPSGIWPQRQGPHSRDVRRRHHERHRFRHGRPESCPIRRATASSSPSTANSYPTRSGSQAPRVRYSEPGGCSKSIFRWNQSKAVCVQSQGCNLRLTAPLSGF